jgi:hypothetical protein
MCVGNGLDGRIKLKNKVDIYKGLSVKGTAFVELYTARCKGV